jgi:hypothetical protein
MYDPLTTMLGCHTGVMPPDNGMPSRTTMDVIFCSKNIIANIGTSAIFSKSRKNKYIQ